MYWRLASPEKVADALPPDRPTGGDERPATEKLTLPVGCMSVLIEVTVAERLAVLQGPVLELTDIVTVGGTVVWAAASADTSQSRATSATTGAEAARITLTLAPVGFIPPMMASGGV